MAAPTAAPAPISDEFRRVKRLRIGARELMSFVAFQAQAPRHVCITRRNLPDGCTVGYVGPDTLAGCLVLLVHHPSFPVVPIGETPPDVDDYNTRSEMYCLATDEEVKARPVYWLKEDGTYEPPVPPLAEPIIVKGRHE